MAQSILYYPKIYIEDGAWLRNAILYWDEVSSIVPYENYEYFSPELSYLQNLGVYKAIYPQELFYSNYVKDFCDSVVRRIKAQDRFMPKNDNRIQNERERRPLNKMYSPVLHDLIHYNKLTPELINLFKEKGFINNYDPAGWIEIDDAIAQIYMRTLAEYSIKCSDKDIVLGTDTVTHSREIYSHSGKHTALHTQCCKINIVNCLPQPSMNVSFEDILNFKERRKDELNAFREKIRTLEENIYKADSPELIKHYENQFIESWEHCSKDFYKVLKESSITFVLGSLVSLVAVPCISEAISKHIESNWIHPFQMGGALIKIAIDYFNYKNKLSPAKSDGGFSYIIKANNAGIIDL